MDYVDICPPSVVYEIQQADPRSAASSGLITWVEVNSDRLCAVAALEAVAGRLGPDSDFSVLDLFCNAVATYAPMLDDAQKEVIRAAYLRFPYNPAMSFNYFVGLRKAGIDIRETLRGRVGIDWTFTSPRRDAQTWDYHLYLASLGDPEALAALADKIAATRNGNSATLLLISLSDVPGAAVDAVLDLYAEDKRTADGVDGPGLSIADTIRLQKMMRPAP